MAWHQRPYTRYRTHETRLNKVFLCCYELYLSSRLIFTSLQLSAVNAGPSYSGHVQVQDQAGKTSKSFNFAYSVQYHVLLTFLTLALQRASSATVSEVKDVSSRTARKVAFYAPSPYKKSPIEMTNFETYIFWPNCGRSESGGYGEDTVASIENLGWTAATGLSGGDIW